MRRRPWIAGCLPIALVVPAGCGGTDGDSTPSAKPGGGGGATKTAAARGKVLYERDTCASCHSLDGSKRTGPSFQGLAGSTVRLEGGKAVRADAAYLERRHPRSRRRALCGLPGRRDGRLDPGHRRAGRPTRRRRPGRVHPHRPLTFRKLLKTTDRREGNP